MIRKEYIFSAIVLAGLGYYFWQPQNSWEIVNEDVQISKIVAFGDSLTAGVGATLENSYPGQLAKILGRDIENAGRSGDTTASALARLKKDVLSKNPDLVLVTLGGNDLKNRVELGESMERLEKIFQDIQSTGAAVVYLSIDPPLVGDNWLLSVKDVCKRNGVLWVDRIMQGLWDNGDLMSDSIHPNAKGYGLIAVKVGERIRKFFPDL
jgi:lysophospholipase L1-like esterase